MTPPARIALARSVLVAGVVVVVAAASLPWVVDAGVDVFHAVVAVLRGAGHGLLSVEDGFVTATVVTAATAPLPALVAAAVPTSDRRAVGWATLGTGVLVSIIAARSPSAGATWVSLAVASAVGLLLGCLALASSRARTAASTPRSRRIATWLIAVYGVGVVLVGFTGSPVDAGLHPGILRVLDVAHRSGLPDWFGYGALEFTANVAFFVPLGLLVVLLTGARRCWLGAVSGLIVSAGIETGQALFLPARFASCDDVLANTSGAVIGALIGVVVLRWAAEHRNR